MKIYLILGFLALMMSCASSNKNNSTAEETKKEVRKPVPADDASSENNSSDTKVEDKKDVDSEYVDIPIIRDTMYVKVNDTVRLAMENHFNTGTIWVKVGGDSLTLIDTKVENVDNTNFQVNTYSGLDKGVYKVTLENKRPFGKKLPRKVLKRTIIVE